MPISTWTPIDRGLKHDKPPTELPQGHCVEAESVLFDAGIISKRTGYAALGTALTGVPCLVTHFVTLAGSNFPIILTTTNAYSWAPSAWTSRVASMTASQDSYFSATMMNNLLIFTNHTEPVKTWDGAAASASNLAGGAGYQTATTHRAAVVVEFMDSLFLMNIFEDGTAIEQRVRWSDIGTPSTWTSANFVDLVDDQRGVMGARQVGADLAIFKPRSITICRYLGRAYSPWSFDTAVPDLGCESPRTIAAYHNQLFFLGMPPAIYAWDGASLPQKVSLPVDDVMFTDTVLGYLHATPNRAWGMIDQEHGLYFVGIPSASAQVDKVWVLNIATGAWSTIGWTMRAGGMAVPTTTLVQFPIIVNASGVAQQVNWTATNDGATAIDGYWTTPDLTFEEEGLLHTKRITQIAFDAKGDAVTLTYSIDGGVTYRSIRAVTLTSGWAHYRVSMNDTGRNFRFRFRNSTAAQTFSLRGPLTFDIQKASNR